MNILVKLIFWTVISSHQVIGMSLTKVWVVKVIQCFVLVMEYIRGSEAPECIFHKQHKTLYNLFSPDPAVSCVADRQVSNREIYTLCSILQHLI